MDLQQLRYIVAVHQDRHFQKAARRCGIRQPTLSQQIQKLERELGVALFERSPHGVSLTPAGESFLPQAMAMLESLDSAVRHLRQSSGDLSGRIRLAAIPTVGPYLLPPLIRALHRQAPQLTLELHELTTSMLLEHLKQGKVDLGILALPVDVPGLLTRSFGQEPFRLAVPRAHRLAGARRVSMKDVLKERLLILKEGHCFRNQMLSFCKLTARDPRILFEGSSLTSVMRLAAAGEGVTLVPHIAAEPRQNPDLAFVPFAPPEPRRELGVVWRITTPLTRAHEWLMELTETTFRKLL